jgi:dolichyl-phosphate-mannose--protein O-mannosyl transferase
VILGYPPILWFDDSYNYVYDAFTHRPDVIRANGYPFFLQLLLPMHSVYPIGLVQAAMGVAMGIVIYALLRRRGLPWWGAALAAVPVLFDAYQLHLEHMITSDVLFVFLITVAIVILCWNDRPSVLVMALAGLLIGYATLVRSVGQPLLVVILVAMLIRRVGWRRLVTLLVAGVVPIAAYMIWFHGTTGKYALTQSLGPFLYSRVSAFAD